MGAPRRSKPKPKLRDITRHKPSQEELAALRDLLQTGPAIVGAILGQAFVEHELDLVLRLRIKSDDIWNLMTGEHGPLSGFYQKILFGYSLGYYNKEIYDYLNLIRDIRNVFAHAKHVVSFDHPTIIKELKSIPISSKISNKQKTTMQSIKDGKLNWRDAYIQLCYVSAIFLMRRQSVFHRTGANNIGRKIARIDQKIRENEPSPFLGSLGRAAALTPQEFPEDSPEFDSPNHNDDPSPPIRKSSEIANLLREKIAKNKKGKEGQ